MTAPHLAGPSGPGEHAEPDHPDRSDRLGRQHDGPLHNGSGVEDRSEVVARLAARLAAIESRDHAPMAVTSRHQPVPGVDRTGEAPATARQSRRFDRPFAPTGRTVSTVSAGQTAPTGTTVSTSPSVSTGPPVPIGASGSTRSERRRGGEPGGHPEDQPGDPEAVAKAICLRQLTSAARPRAALAATLRQRGIPDDVAGRVLDRFVEVGLIDDQAYAQAFVAAKHRERALGVTALRTELRRKGVDDQIVDVAVQAVDQDAERDRASALIARRVDAAMANGLPTARRRLVGLLARRGYSGDLACQVVDEALAAYDAEDHQQTW